MQRVRFCSTRSARKLKLLRKITLVCGTLTKRMGRYFILSYWQTRTHCCGHIVADTNVSRLPAHTTFVADTNLSGTQKMVLILFRNILWPQQMFPSFCAQGNIMSNNVSATLCPRLPVPLKCSCTFRIQWNPHFSNLQGKLV